MSSSGCVTVIGVGEDGLDGLAPEAARIIAEAEVLCGGARHLRLIGHPTAEQIEITADLDGLLVRIEGLGARRVVVLASGDPCHFGIGPRIAQRFGPEQVRIIPNVSAAALAFARIGESWHDASVVSAHGRPLEPAIRKLANVKKAAILTDSRNTPAAVAKALLRVGVEDCESWVFEHLGGPEEGCFRGRLSEVAERAFRDLNVMVIIRRQATSHDQQFGRVEAAFGHHAGLVTKAEVRAVSLSKLRLERDGILWDVGAGCGSLSIEAAGLMPRGSVYAIERAREQVRLLEENVRAFRRRGLVKIVAGEAPAALGDLPDPTAVFIGGSGGAIESILETAYERVRVGGTIVANLATIEHVAACTSWSGRRGIVAEVVEIQIARSAGIAGLTRFVAQNPVFVTSVERSS